MPDVSMWIAGITSSQYARRGGRQRQGPRGVGLGLAACEKGLTKGFQAVAALVNELMEARDERRLMKCQKRLSRLELLITDELGFVLPSRTGRDLLLEMFSQSYETGSVMVTTNLSFDESTKVF